MTYDKFNDEILAVHTALHKLREKLRTETHDGDRQAIILRAVTKEMMTVLLVCLIDADLFDEFRANWRLRQPGATKLIR